MENKNHAEEENFDIMDLFQGAQAFRLGGENGPLILRSSVSIGVQKASTRKELKFPSAERVQSSIDFIESMKTK